jgi:hypothetical protein
MPNVAPTWRESGGIGARGNNQIVLTDSASHSVFVITLP